MEKRNQDANYSRVEPKRSWEEFRKISLSDKKEVEGG
jgi:hypothetical protein